MPVGKGAKLRVSLCQDASPGDHGPRNRGWVCEGHRRLWKSCSWQTRGWCPPDAHDGKRPRRPAVKSLSREEGGGPRNDPRGSGGVGRNSPGGV